MDEKSLLRYVELLREDVFFTKTKWPQFDLLINELANFATDFPAGRRVLSLERNALYGGSSLFSPLFFQHHFQSIDCSPPINRSRGAYNAALVERINSEFGHDLAPTISSDLENIATAECDLVLVPNLLHHVADLDLFFSTIDRVMARGATGYIFDSTLREWHQMPEDYYRLTPFAISLRLEQLGLQVVKTSTTGGPFTSILYCWYQALEYLSTDSELHGRLSSWLEDEHRKQLLDLEDRFNSNPIRPASMFPTAYSVTFRKPM